MTLNDLEREYRAYCPFCNRDLGRVYGGASPYYWCSEHDTVIAEVYETLDSEKRYLERVRLKKLNDNDV